MLDEEPSRYDIADLALYPNLCIFIHDPVSFEINSSNDFAISNLLEDLGKNAHQEVLFLTIPKAETNVYHADAGAIFGTLG